MPLTSTAMVVCALSMIGLPPFAGFFSKWYLALGAIQNGQWYFVAVLILSSLLSAIYFFRIIEKIFMDKGTVTDGQLPHGGHEALSGHPLPEDGSLQMPGYEPAKGRTLPWQMLLPMAIVIMAVIGLGLGNAYIVNGVLKTTLMEVFLV